MKSGYLFVISGPSGVGKSTVANALLEDFQGVSRIVTCTSREMRAGETADVDYHFIERDTFIEKIENGEFIEYAEVYGNYYGVLFSTVEESLKKQKASLLVINWEGFFKIKEKFSEQTKGIFINPPSFKELVNRIRGRQSDSEEVITKRLQAAENDMSYAKYYDFVIENDEVDLAAKNIKQIICKVIGEC